MYLVVFVSNGRDRVSCLMGLETHLLRDSPGLTIALFVVGDGVIVTLLGRPCFGTRFFRIPLYPDHSQAKHTLGTVFKH